MRDLSENCQATVVKSEDCEEGEKDQRLLLCLFFNQFKILNFLNVTVV